jgi:hypothetical protein
MNEELTTLIIKELSRYQSHKKVIQKVCAQSGLNWKQAEQLVILIEARRRRTTITRQSPPYLFLSIAALFFGFGLLAFNVHILLVLLQKDVLGQTVSLQSNYWGIIELISGLGLATAGLIGLRKALLYMFPG